MPSVHTRKKTSPRFARSAVSLCVLLSVSAAHGEAYFDPGMMQPVDGAPAIGDLNAVMANQKKEGTYHVYIDVNGEKFATGDIQFSLKKDELVPCVPMTMYAKIGIDPSASDVHLNPEKDDRTCVLLTEAVPVAQSSFDFLTKKLSLSFPQSTLRAHLKDEIPAALWDDGIPALLVGYQASGSQTLQSQDESSKGSDNFVNLKNGINLGAWRLRNLSTFTQSSDAGTHWDSTSTYIERALPGIKGELVVGDAYTTGDLFDSIRIKGVQVASDTDMVPDSINGFAPVIRGIAKSNATVTIRQNNNIIYQTNVAPGPFAITDLAPVSSGGSLEVTVKEADGTETRYNQAFASMPILQRKGSLKYAFSAGKYSEAEAHGTEPDVFQAVLAYGLPYSLTLLSGLQHSNEYQSVDLGLGLDLGFLGAVSLDVAKQKATLSSDDENREGSATHFVWQNHINKTRSDINLDLTQYSKRYISFADTYADTDAQQAKKQQLSLSFNQALTDTQSLFVSMNKTDYQNSASAKMYQVGFNTPLWKLNASVTFGLNQNLDENGSVTRDKQLLFNFSLPLSVFDSASTANATAMITNDLKGNSNQTVGVNGNIMNSPALTYNTQFGYNVKKHDDDTKNANVGATYKGRYGEAQVGYNQDDQQKQFTYGLNGQLVLHRHGLTLGQYSDGAIALVSAPGADHVGISNNLGVYTDWRGYTLVPDLTDYKTNSVQIDPDSVGQNMSFENISAEVIPTKDAVVMASFPVNIGRKVLFTLNYKGDVIPFGSQAYLKGSDRMFFVGDRGELFITGASEEGEITVDMTEEHQCKAHYQLPKSKGKLPITMMALACGDQ
ncbi:fimbria/pilus outer membrane usher protein [Lelliottia sp. V86_10]|nr:fimbria/pilus outer membrane usher protein [Lelliottia sp. V86_10]MDK9587585.1 fimbria/pilus outer membrane usher protein [Lelliottia sp. V86_10]